MAPHIQKIIFGALLGWAAALCLICLLFGEDSITPGTILLSAFPGVICGLAVVFLIEWLGKRQGSGTSGTGSATQQLLELQQLYNSGLITKEEYAASKSKVLNGQLVNLNNIRQNYQQPYQQPGRQNYQQPYQQPGQQSYQQPYRQYSQQNNGQNAAKADKLTQKLQELKNLRSAGVISPEEYERRKAKITRRYS